MEILRITKNIFFFILAKWQFVLPIAVVLIVTMFVYKACNKPPHLDEQAIQKAQQAIAKQDREQMVKILAESDAKEQALDDTVKGAEKATEDAKKNYTGRSNQELADELNRRANQ